MSNNTANQNDKSILESKYSMKAHNSSYPPVQNYPQWKEVIATKNRYWRIIGKNTKIISLLKLLRSPNTIARSNFLQTKT